MARTAPIPNIPAIPGMNPGTWIMGGGGDGGGKGGRGGTGNGGKQGANGQNGGNDADGGGKGAQSCGPGSPGGCNNCGNQLSAGDPVDVATGRVYTLPSLDVWLPGPLPLELYRKYSSHAVERDVGLGHGWTHSLGWEIVARARSVEIWDQHGTMLEFDLPQVGGEVIHRGWALTRDASGFALEIDGIWRRFSSLDGEGRRYRLTAIEDRNQNRIAITYRNGALAEIVDCVGRVVRALRTPEGRIRGFEVKNAPQQGQWIRLAEYTYDARGDLVAVTDAGGYVARFTYDEDHYLTSYTAPDCPTFHFVYDELHRCVETWGAYPDGSVPGLSDSAPDVLADGRTKAKGFMHCKIEYDGADYREIVDSMQVRRVFVNERGLVEKGISNGHVTTRTFDENGFLATHTDALEATTRWTRDARGRILMTTDALGRTTVFTRNAMGQVEEASDDLGVILRARHDSRGNLVELVKARGEVTTREYDQRGNIVRQTLPNGGVIRYEYDAHCNQTAAVQPDGTTWLYAYDPLGRCVAQTDPRGAVTRFSYDDCGRIVAAFHPNGGVERFSYNGVDAIVQYVDPDGHVYTIDYLLRRVIELKHPNGDRLRYRYNREGYLVEIHNEKGEVRYSTYNPDGLVTEIRSFNGRTQRFKYDAMNRLIEYTNGRGEKTELVRDRVGSVVEVNYPDDTRATFEYDARGRLTRATNDAGEYLYEMDAAGQLVREAHTVDRRTYAVEHEYDVMRRPVRLSTSLGHEHATERDVMGRPRWSELASDPGGGERVDFAYDPVGRELRRSLSGGAVQESEYGLEGGVARRRVTAGQAAPLRVGAGQPAWVGPLPSTRTVDKAFQYSLNAENILRRWDQSLGAREYAYDAREQLTAVSSGAQLLEAYRYDAAGNVSEASVGRKYGPGNTLLEKGAASYVWDADGCLAEKRVRRPDGGEDRWRYEWSGAGNLARVHRPDGAVIELAYDPFARRVAKRVYRRDDAGALVPVASVRFVWDKDRIVHEIREAADERGDPVVSERTYAYDRRFGHPLAEREDIITPAGRQVGAWVYHVNDPIGTPEHLIAGDGRVVGELRRSAWGATETSPGSQATTALRFRGQLHDPETGLHYNRYRYYDPDIGRYLSEDPHGGLPDANVYRYCVNPVTGVDPLGLAHHATATFTPRNGQPIALNGGQPFSSSYDCEPDDYSRQYNAENGITPFRNLTARDEDGNLVHRTSDTEAQIIRDLERRRDEEGLELDGGHLEIDGQLPPCSSCHRRMEDFASANNCTIEYRWPGNPSAHQVAARTAGSRRYP
ncbi:RHS repeat-associated core domain-containing protein [Sorangium sp. So ce1024]|uniref:RHS repeat-associated core domain-containing protein n=1 Tax=Sorangium sp. So ce1024 TaxID=3133327 RepID=UPI003F03B60F